MIRVALSVEGTGATIQPKLLDYLQMAQAKECFMKKELGLWIDRQNALIVKLTEAGAETSVIHSNIGRHVRFTGGTRSKLPHTIQAAEDKQNRKYLSQLGHYYDEVVDEIRGADSIFIFGPGEAKIELGKHLVSARLGRHVVGMETTDKLTESQIVVKVREHFLNKN